MEQADSALTALSGIVALATIYRALVYRRPGRRPGRATGEAVGGSPAHAAREAGTRPAA
ncbi:hypothetical protein OTB20_33410 [Streptomyces sp. H27-H1]|uniref:hypothetical protein n=1 Tax=Streptomyces sp. H27-H1 TaxID=2996461 RepID=UPI00226DE566|nr:hypothetical protein [Streptomyces sp. H27-H1]MCY0931006.1 hypothetical protein [Streptomyces sp. H27-H1]